MKHSEALEKVYDLLPESVKDGYGICRAIHWAHERGHIQKGNLIFLNDELGKSLERTAVKDFNARVNFLYWWRVGVEYISPGNLKDRQAFVKWWIGDLKRREL